MKGSIFAVVIPALLAAGAANAAEIYNKDSNKLDLYGKVDARHQFSKATEKSEDDPIRSEDGDASYVRLGFRGETQINSQLTGYGRWEYNIQASNAESNGAEGNKTRLGFAGLKFAQYGSLDYGRNYGVLYDINVWTDVLPVFGADSMSQADTYMTGRATGVLTYRNTDFFGLVDGLNFALQYQGKNDDSNKNGRNSLRKRGDIIKPNGGSNGDGFGISATYDIGYGISVGGAYSNADRPIIHERLVTSVARGERAEAWNIGAKYDANNVYLAAMYGETHNMTSFGYQDVVSAKTQNLELTAQYQFDSGLRPSLAYVQSKGTNFFSKQDWVKYIAIGSYYNFNKNLSAYVDYKINLVKDNIFTQYFEVNTKNAVGVGLVYQF
ncbi:porin [Photorhabdus temperata]|uniref:Outer membrane protein (Porin) n=1 Tax=Photorhabdus temperata subsp. temperata Meg1 TaxID=1393735 RepID=A0A081RT95_PHOTE|nr:porin [Photorhabdus temperata]KER01898.1 outer membrane protein (porin) [Photorhabdus temperata subsp. temperata Meg1]MCT8346961.1 porin [Photorhabdus temperata]